MTSQRTLKVAVIGSGISGLYCAYEIGKKNPTWDITIFEGTPRSGGRLESVKLEGIDGFHGDFGAMRFLPNDHTKLFQLIKDMNMESQVQDFPSPARENTLYFLRGHYLTHKEIDEGKLDMYPNMTKIEKLKANDTIELQNYYNRKVLEPNQTTDDVYEWVCKDGTKAKSKGVLNAWSGIATDDAIQFLAQVDLHPGGLYDNATLSEFITPDETQTKVAKFSSHNMYSKKARSRGPDQLKTLHEGMGSLADAVKGKFLSSKSLKHQLMLNHTLLSVDIVNGNFKLKFQRPGYSVLEVYAEELILAIPQAAIDRINFLESENSKPLDDAIRPLLPCVDGKPAGKTFLVYNTKWWTDSDIIGIPSSKLPLPGEPPIMQWGTDTYANTVVDLGAINQSTTDKHVLLLYHEWDFAREFWRSLADPSGDRHNVTDAHKNAARTLLAQIFSVADPSDIPPELDAHCVAWRDGPYYGGWYSTNGQYNYPELRIAIEHPVADKNLHKYCKQAPNDVWKANKADSRSEKTSCSHQKSWSSVQFLRAVTPASHWHIVSCHDFPQYQTMCYLTLTCCRLPVTITRLRGTHGLQEQAAEMQGAMQKLYIVGEAYSDQHGWIEGALNTSQSVLSKYYDITFNTVNMFSQTKR